MQDQEKQPTKRSDVQSITKNRIQKNNLQMAFSEHGRVPPQAVDLEEAVLGALMLEQNALTAVVDILKPDVFYKEAHQVIYAAIHRLFAKSEPIDILTVTNELKSSGELELIGGAYYITQLTNRVASTANIEYHARIISQKFIQRELIKLSSEIIKDAFEDTTDVFDLLDKAEKNLFAVSETNFRRDYDSMQSLVREAIKDIESARDHEGNLRGVPSGFTDVDRITGGWQKSDLVILAARPGMGKTAFVLSMARNIAVDFNIPLAIFSLEMSSIQLVTRLISSETQLSADRIARIVRQLLDTGTSIWFLTFPPSAWPVGWTAPHWCSVMWSMTRPIKEFRRLRALSSIINWKWPGRWASIALLPPNWNITFSRTATGKLSNNTIRTLNPPAGTWKTTTYCRAPARNHLLPPLAGT